MKSLSKFLVNVEPYLPMHTNEMKLCNAFDQVAIKFLEWSLHKLDHDSEV